MFSCDAKYEVSKLDLQAKHTCYPLSKYSRSSGDCNESLSKRIRMVPLDGGPGTSQRQSLHFQRRAIAHQERNCCSMSATLMHSAPMLNSLAVSCCKTRSYRFSKSGFQSLLR